MRGGAWAASAEYVDDHRAAEPFAAPLPPPPATASELAFRARSLGEVRMFAARQAAAAGLWVDAADAAVRAVTAVAGSAPARGGQGGSVAAWRDGPTLLFEVREDGHLTDPLAGRRRPEGEQAAAGDGLWLANQICDLVQVRSTAAGTVVRLHLSCA